MPAAPAVVMGAVVVAEDEEERDVEDDADDGDDHHEEAVDGHGVALEPACAVGVEKRKEGRKEGGGGVSISRRPVHGWFALSSMGVTTADASSSSLFTH
jgi:hypothetical protein